MAFVAQCTGCSTLTMMDRCPKCGGQTKPYEGAGGTATSRSWSGPRPSTTAAPPANNTKSKLFAVPASHPSAPPNTTAAQQNSTVQAVQHSIASLHAQLDAKNRELDALKHDTISPSNHHRLSPQRPPGELDGRVAASQQELSSVWSLQMRERQLVNDAAALRERCSELLTEKDQWSADKLRMSEGHRAALKMSDEQLQESRRECQTHLSKVAELELHLSDAQRKHFESEQLVHSYAQRMAVATDEVRELQRAVASSKEADRRELDRSKADVNTLQRRLTEVEDELKHLRLRQADVRDELESSTALRAVVTQKLNTAMSDITVLEEAKHSLERQLHLSSVEQQALAQEAKQMREKLIEATTRIDALDARKTELTNEVKELRDARVHTSQNNNSSEIQLLRTQLQTTSTDLSQATKERIAAMEAAETLRGEVRRLNSANQALDEEVSHARGTNDMLAKELATLRGEIRRIGQEFQSSQAAQQATYQRHCDDLRDEARRADVERQTAMERLERGQREAEVVRAAHDTTRMELQTTVRELQGDVQRLSQLLKTAQDELERKRDVSPTKTARSAALVESRLADFQATVDKQHKSMQDLQSECDHQRQMVEDAQRSLQQERARAQGLHDIISATLRETGNICSKEDLPAAVRAFTRERNLAIEERETGEASSQREIASLRDEISDLRGHVQRSGVDAEKASQRTIQLERDYRKLQVDMENQLRQHSTDAQQYLQQTGDEYRVQLSRMTKEVSRLQDALRGVEELHTASEEKLRQAENDKRRLLEQVSNAEERQQSQAQSADQARHRESELMRILQQEQDNAESQRRQERDLKDQIQLLRADNSKLRRDTEAAAHILATAMEEERRLQESEHDRLSRDLEQARLQLKLERDRRAVEGDVTRSAESRCLELETQMDTIKLEREHYAREVATMRNAHKATTDAFQARIVDLESQSHEEASQLRDFMNRIAQRDQEVADYKRQVADLERALQALRGEKDVAMQRLGASTHSLQSRGVSHQPHLRQHSASPTRTGLPRPLHSPSADHISSAAPIHRDDHSYDRGLTQQSTYDAPPAQQKPIPQPQSSAARVVTSGLSARERNDALLAQFREQRALSSGSSAHTAVPLGHRNASPSASGGGGVRLGSLRR